MSDPIRSRSAGRGDAGALTREENSGAQSHGSAGESSTLKNLYAVTRKGRRGIEPCNYDSPYLANKICSHANTDRCILMREAPLDLIGLFSDALVQELLCKQVTHALIFPGSTFKYKAKH